MGRVGRPEKKEAFLSKSRFALRFLVLTYSKKRPSIGNEIFASFIARSENTYPLTAKSATQKEAAAHQSQRPSVRLSARYWGFFSSFFFSFFCGCSWWLGGGAGCASGLFCGGGAGLASGRF